MTERDAALAAIAARHGFSPGAIAALDEALRRGGGRMAQFSHPELGGMGQWSGGGLLQIGAMFDHALKARVAAALADLAAAEPSTGGATPPVAAPASPLGRDAAAWWPAELGQPSASGAQDGLRYAWFARARRLAIVDRDRVTLYDTAHHRISGVSQSRSRVGHLVFTAADGAVDLGGLRIVGSALLTKD